MMTKFAFTLPLAAALAVAGGVPSAFGKDGWYAGLGLGMARGTIKDSVISDFAAAAGVSPSALSKDSNSHVYKAFVGYSMTQYLGFEGGVFTLGSRGWSVADANTGGVLNATTKTYGGNLDLIAALPLGGWRFFGRVGGYYGHSDLSFGSEGGAPAPSPTQYSKNRFNWKVGAGIGYEFASNVGFRAEWERYRVDIGSGDHMYVDSVTGSVLYRF